MARTVVTLDGVTWDVGGAAITTNPVGATGTAGGDLTGTYPNPTIAALAVTDAKVATANKDGAAGTPSMRTLSTTGTTACAGNDSRLSDSRAPNGSAGGDLTGTYPNPTLAAAGGGAAGPLGSATVAPIVTVDAKGRVTALSSATIVPTNAAGGDLTGNYPNPTIAVASKARDYRAQSFVANAVAESFPRYLVNSNGSILSSGRLCCANIPVVAGDVVTSVSWHSVSTALSAGTNWWFALCDSSFNVIRQSTDQLSGAWGSNTLKTLTVDSIPVTAGARVASTTVTLTFPTLSQALTSLIAVNDSVVVSNANIAAYNGTFTVVSVTATQITYVSGGSATDSLSAPFPTVQLAAGKRTYSVPSSGTVYGVVMVKATVPTLAAYSGGVGGATADGTATGLQTLCANGDTGLSGTCPSPIAHATGLSTPPWAAIA